MEPHTRLKQARIALGDEIVSVARRTGVPEQRLHTIEDGRFEDLPRGIYGRAAIRAFAVAVGLDPTEILTACEPLLPVLDDPISGLGRLRGIRQPKVQTSRPEPEMVDEPRASRPDWRLAAAAALDAGLIGALLMAVVVSASVVAGAPLSALAGSALAFALISLLLGSSYFFWLGGISGATGGERWIGRRPSSARARCLNLRAIAIRAARSATDDVRFIRELGVWIGRLPSFAWLTRCGSQALQSSSRARSSVG